MRGKKKEKGHVRVARAVDPYVSSSGWLISFIYIMVLLLNKLGGGYKCDGTTLKFGYSQTKNKRILE